MQLRRRRNRSCEILEFDRAIFCRSRLSNAASEVRTDLSSGAKDANTNRGEGANVLPDFHFDAQTPPMCFLHGDADVYAPLGSVEAYKRLRKMNIPAEIHIFAKAPHGFPHWVEYPNTTGWRDRCAAWLDKMGF
ncbi:MAG: alpha/beta hydrolase [Thermoguttaceae bacterium]